MCVWGRLLEGSTWKAVSLQALSLQWSCPRAGSTNALEPRGAQAQLRSLSSCWATLTTTIGGAGKSGWSPGSLCPSTHLPGQEVTRRQASQESVLNGSHLSPQSCFTLDGKCPTLPLPCPPVPPRPSPGNQGTSKTRRERQPSHPKSKSWLSNAENRTGVCEPVEPELLNTWEFNTSIKELTRPKGVGQQWGLIKFQGWLRVSSAAQEAGPGRQQGKGKQSRAMERERATGRKGQRREELPNHHKSQVSI